jgi:hypothetical protein
MKWPILMSLLVLSFAVEARAQCPGGCCPRNRTVIEVPVTAEVSPPANPTQPQPAVNSPRGDRRRPIRTALKSAAENRPKLFRRK